MAREFILNPQMGFLAATPFLVKSLSGPFGGITADLLRRRGLSTKSVRRLYFAVGKYPFFVVILLYFNKNIIIKNILSGTHNRNHDIFSRWKGNMKVSFLIEDFSLEDNISNYVYPVLL